MTESQFQTQLNRLAETYGKAAYGTERCKLIWKEVGEYSVEWFGKVIDHLIGSCRQPPLISDFAEAVGKERERIWNIQKQQERTESKNWGMNLSDDDHRMLCDAIRRRAMGALSDEDWSSVMKMIENMGRKSA